jgi:hypothetical protein
MYNYKRRQFADIRVQFTEAKVCWMPKIKMDRTAVIDIICSLIDFKLHALKLKKTL